MKTAPVLTVYFDGACPVCRHEIDFYRRRRGAERICFSDISKVSDGRVAPDLSWEAAMSRLYVRTPVGELRSGVDAFLALWLALPGLRWMGRLGGLPGVRQVLGVGYALFLRWRARNRPASGPCTEACDVKK